MVGLKVCVHIVASEHREIQSKHLISPSRIRCEPMINAAPMCANGTKTHVPSASSSSDFLNADRDDLQIRWFREGSADTIIDVRETNLDSKPYKNLLAKKALEQ